MLFQKIEKPSQGRRFVISDIHGCAKTFQKLVKDEIQLTKNDQLFLLGDYIDRGPDSVGVLDFILELDYQGFNVFPLRGNHEQDLLENWHFYGNLKTVKNLETFIHTCQINKVVDLLTAKGELKSRYFHFLKNLAFYYELPDFYLVHAGFNFDKESPFQEYEDMLWLRKFSEKKLTTEQTQGKRIVVGHSVHQLPQIQQFIQEKNVILSLDNGCFYGVLNLLGYYQGQYGQLCALNLDSLELIVQVCID